MINKNVLTFIQIVKAGLLGNKAAIPNDFDLGSLYVAAKKHRIMNLVFHGAVCSGADEKHEAMQKLYSAAVAEVIFHEKQKTELYKLFCELEKNKINYMPLKGTVLKELYKKPELRSMGDADILIKMEEYPRIKEIMQRLGFEFKKESSNEIVWKKEGFLTVELHSALFPSFAKELYNPFKDIWSRALKDGSEYRHRMSFEDEFVYNFTHFVKHYKFGGIGVKHLCDLYVLMSERSLDLELIDREIEKLHLTEFYRNIRKTLNFWFSDGKSDEKVELITKTIIKSGAFGTKKTSQNAFALRLASENEALKGKGKLTVWMFKVFPKDKFIEHKYAFLKKHKWLLPVAWVHRWFDALFLNRRKIKNGIKAIKNTNSDKMTQIEKDFLAVGLNFNYTEE